eukprot:5043270-Prymnesium_polylepis.1
MPARKLLEIPRLLSSSPLLQTKAKKFPEIHRYPQKISKKNIKEICLSLARNVRLPQTALRSPELAGAPHRPIQASAGVTEHVRVVCATRRSGRRRSCSGARQEAL